MLTYSFSLHLKTPFFHVALLLHLHPGVQLVYLGSEVLSHFVPLGLQRRSEQVVLDGEQLGVDVDGPHLKDTHTHMLAHCVKQDDVSLPGKQHLLPEHSMEEHYKVYRAT